MKPATALPWYVGNHPGDSSGTGWRQILTNSEEFGGAYVSQALDTDAAYITHACNAYPELVAALRAILALDDGDKPDLWHFEKEFDQARALLRRLGEEA